MADKKDIPTAEGGKQKRGGANDKAYADAVNLIYLITKDGWKDCAFNKESRITQKIVAYLVENRILLREKNSSKGYRYKWNETYIAPTERFINKMIREIRKKTNETMAKWLSKKKSVGLNVKFDTPKGAAGKKNEKDSKAALLAAIPDDAMVLPDDRALT